MLLGERPKRDLLYVSGSALDRFKLAHERMLCSDFVVAVSADEEKIAQIGSAQHVFQEVERRRVEPLQIIEKQRERMLRASEDADELAKHHLKAPLRVLRWKLRDRRRLADDELHFRNETDDQSCVWSQRLLERVAPRRNVRFAFA